MANIPAIHLELLEIWRRLIDLENSSLSGLTETPPGIPVGDEGDSFIIVNTGAGNNGEDTYNTKTLAISSGPFTPRVKYIYQGATDPFKPVVEGGAGFNASEYINGYYLKIQNKISFAIGIKAPPGHKLGFGETGGVSYNEINQLPYLFGGLNGTINNYDGATLSISTSVTNTAFPLQIVSRKSSSDPMQYWNGYVRGNIAKMPSIEGINLASDIWIYGDYFYERFIMSDISD